MIYLIVNYELGYRDQLVRGFETLSFKRFPSCVQLTNHFIQSFHQQNPGLTEPVSVLIMGLFRLSKKEFQLWMAPPIGVLTPEK